MPLSVLNTFNRDSRRYCSLVPIVVFPLAFSSLGGDVVRHGDCLASQGMDRLLTMLMMFYFISRGDTCTSTSDPNNNPGCAVESSPLRKYSHGAETPDDGGRAVDPICSSSSKECSTGTVRTTEVVVSASEQSVARATGVRAGVSCEKDVVEAGQIIAGVSSSNGGVNIGRLQKRGDKSDGSCTAAAKNAEGSVGPGDEGRDVSIGRDYGRRGCHDYGGTAGSGSKGSAKGGGNGSSEGHHSASLASCSTRTSIDRKEISSSSTSTPSVKTAVKEMPKRSALVEGVNEATTIEAESITTNERLIKTTPGEKAPDSERPANTAGAVKGEVEASVLLGERVYKVFAGLFEGFRLHDLYVPERGGVLVCTEVRGGGVVVLLCRSLLLPPPPIQQEPRTVV